ncbi:MAG: hypothetical protein J7M25_13325 [Deltaproteobacteria bacterium]|nr:hypothetical protein [Deltaproteobacteria bacterium]
MSPRIPAILDDLEIRIEKLKIRYEQYFMGIQRFEPVKDRRFIDRAIRHLRLQVIGNTALKFRFLSIVQKFTSYQTYWNRVQRQIEEGTYRKDLLKLQRRLKKQGISAPDLLKAHTSGEVESALARYMAFGQRRAGATHTGSGHTGEFPSSNNATPILGANDEAGDAKEAEPSIRNHANHQTPPPLPADASGMPTTKQLPLPKDSLRRLHHALIEARRSTGESTEGLTIDRLAQSIAKQLPKIQRSSGTKDVEFVVQVEEGKARLKAITKKEPS